MENYGFQVEPMCDDDNIIRSFVNNDYPERMWKTRTSFCLSLIWVRTSSQVLILDRAIELRHQTWNLDKASELRHQLQKFEQSSWIETLNLDRVIESRRQMQKLNRAKYKIFRIKTSIVVGSAIHIIMCQCHLATLAVPK